MDRVAVHNRKPSRLVIHEEAVVLDDPDRSMSL